MNFISAIRSLAAIANPIPLIPELVAGPQIAPEEAPFLNPQAMLMEKFKEFASDEAVALAQKFAGLAITHAPEISERVTRVLNSELLISGEELPSDLLRNVAGNLARAGEAIAGAPGDFISEVDKALEVPELFGLPENVQKPFKLAREFGKKNLPNLPTSSELREAGKELTGGYLEPRTPAERHVQEFTSEVAATLNPLLPGKKSKIIKSVAAVALEHGVKQAAMALGAGEDTADIVKSIWSAIPNKKSLLPRKKPKIMKSVRTVAFDRGVKHAAMALGAGEGTADTVQSLWHHIPKKKPRKGGKNAHKGISKTKRS